MVSLQIVELERMLLVVHQFVQLAKKDIIVLVQQREKIVQQDIIVQMME